MPFTSTIVRRALSARHAWLSKQVGSSRTVTGKSMTDLLRDEGRRGLFKAASRVDPLPSGNEGAGVYP